MAETSLREALAALADEWDGRRYTPHSTRLWVAVRAIRALLAAHPAPANQPETSRLTDHERTEIGWAIERDWQQRTDGRGWDATFAVVETIIAARVREEGGRHE